MVNNWYSYSLKSSNPFYEVAIVHDSSVKHRDSVAVSVPRSKGKVEYADIVDENGDKLNQEQITEEECYTSGHYQTTQKYVSSIAASVPAKSSAKITEPFLSGVFMCVTIADGKDIFSSATSGIEVDALATTNAASFSKAMSRVFDVNARANPTKDSIEILNMSIRGIAVNEPYAAVAQNTDNIPSLSSVRNNADGNLEVLVSGEQTAIIAYKDGTYDLISTDKAINALQDKRNITPAPDKTSEIGDTRSYARHGNRLTHIVANPNAVASVIISSDDMIDKLLTTKIKRNGKEASLATVADIIEADGQKLSMLKRQLCTVEKNIMGKIRDDKTVVKVDITPASHFDTHKKFHNVQTYECGSRASSRSGKGKKAEWKFERLPLIEIETPKKPKIEEVPVIYMDADKNKEYTKTYPSGQDNVGDERAPASQQKKRVPVSSLRARGR